MEPSRRGGQLPTYNRAYNLGASIESVLQQTYRNTEILIVDDGSTDETAKVVAKYGPQVRYLFQRNTGPAAACNCGFRHARGEFIALNDSDDRWWPWKLEAQVNALGRYPDVGMVWTDCTAVTDRGERLDRAWLRNRYSAWRSLQIDRVCERRAALEELCPSAPPDLAKAPPFVGDLFSQMILGNLVITSSIVLRRGRLRARGGFDESLARSGEDYEFHLRTCWHGPVAFLDTPHGRSNRIPRSIDVA